MKKRTILDTGLSIEFDDEYAIVPAANSSRLID